MSSPYYSIIRAVERMCDLSIDTIRRSPLPELRDILTGDSYGGLQVIDRPHVLTREQADELLKEALGYKSR